MSFAPSTRSGSIPTPPPSVSLMPTLPADEHNVRSSSDAPRWLKKRRSMPAKFSRPIVPA
jgi:hypothetical protein